MIGQAWVIFLLLTNHYSALGHMPIFLDRAANPVICGTAGPYRQGRMFLKERVVGRYEQHNHNI